MRRYTPRRGVTAPRWFVTALLGGTAALTAATAVLPHPAAKTAETCARPFAENSWSIAP